MNQISSPANIPISAGGICLNMIVRDEQDVIERCLRSAIPHIHSWCIVDTGSTDRTKELIVRTMAGIPGQLHERPWVNFAHNRNEAWELALERRPSYLMFMDADEELAIDGSMPTLGNDAYLIAVHYQGQLENRFWMVRSDYPHRWVGARHEDIESHGSIAKVLGTMIVSHSDGARAKNRAKAGADDVEALLKMISEEPENPRHWYYLGATHVSMGNMNEAEQAFAVRAKMAGNERELMKAKSFLDFYRRTQTVGA